MTKPVPLSWATLDRLPEAIARPAYRRQDLTPGIVHFGVGNFHRAHQAVYLDNLMNQGFALDWGIVGAGVLSSDTAMQRRLASQEFLTTLVAQDGRSQDVRVLGSMLAFVPPEDKATLLRWLADPRIRIVSLTITEGGYFIDPVAGTFHLDHPAIVADAQNLASPSTVFGLIVAALAMRRRSGERPFTVMSCDNLPHNGVVTRHAVVGLARLADPEFASWIEAHVAFPNGMVDRITPATTDEQRAWLVAEHCMSDAAPVFCEPFTQWVLEDRFPAGRPPFEQAGVTFTQDVSPYELMKIRILNGGHAAIAYPAGLLGIHFVHEAMAHPRIAAFLEKLTKTEIIPQVVPVPDTSLETYRVLIAERFANPRVGDTIRRLCLDGSNRQPKFIVPTLVDALNTGGDFKGLALESALWCRYCLGRTEAGAPIAPNDPNWDRLVRTATQAQADPGHWLAMRDIYGDIGRNPAFAAAFARALRSLAERGVIATLEAYVGS
jgi:mannitol 2-dehydrogenase